MARNSEGRPLSLFKSDCGHDRKPAVTLKLWCYCSLRHGATWCEKHKTSGGGSPRSYGWSVGGALPTWFLMLTFLRNWIRSLTCLFYFFRWLSSCPGCVPCSRTVVGCLVPLHCQVPSASCQSVVRAFWLAASHVICLCSEF